MRSYFGVFLALLLACPQTGAAAVALQQSVPAAVVQTPVGVPGAAASNSRLDAGLYSPSGLSLPAPSLSGSQGLGLPTALTAPAGAAASIAASAALPAGAAPSAVLRAVAPIAGSRITNPAAVPSISPTSPSTALKAGAAALPTLARLGSSLREGIASAVAGAAKLGQAFDGTAPKPPATRKSDQADDFFGTKVADPYRWLEDANSPETQAWVAAQNKVSSEYLAAIPGRDAIRARLQKLYDFERNGMPTKHGKVYVFYRNDGKQNQSVLYKSKTLYGKPEVLLDPNQLSKEGTSALAGTSFTKDGKSMAYSVSKSGSDWVEWKIKDVATGEDYPETIRWSKFSGAVWTKDGKGFYYGRYAEPKEGEALSGVNTNQKIYFHKLGTPQSQDSLVYERPDHPTWSFGPSRSEDGRYLLIYQYEGTEPKNRIFIKDLKDPKGGFRPLFDGFDASYSIVDIKGDRIVLLTDKDAPRNRLVSVSLKHPERPWKDIIAQDEKAVLSSAEKAGRRFVATWQTDAHEKITVHGPRGAFQREIPLPAIGTVGGLGVDKKGKGFLQFSSYNHPRTVFRTDFTTGKLRAFKRPKVDFDPKRFTVEQVFYASKDGTKVPMFLVHKKGLKLDGTNPTYLYGYGGFNVSLTPEFSPAEVVWMEMGGVYAVANLRGGGEYGRPWHDGGRRDNKQNVFDDFIAAAEWLIAKGYTSKKRLAIGGGSNGGLLVGAAMTQRPDLFAAALPQVGVLDMLRFHLFTIGAGWKSDYGSAETKAGFDTLIKYSPLHNVRQGADYPATMVMTGDHDDRVVPAHSYKFTAALQEAQGGQAPILARIAKDAGHGGGASMSSYYDEIADMWAFLKKALGMD